MSQVVTPIDVPNRVLAQKHGLWSSAYHLIHPADGSDMPSSDAGDELLIYPSPFIDNPSAEANGISISPKVFAGFNYESDCGGEVHCFYQCQPGFECPPDPSVNAIEYCPECDQYVTYTPSEMVTFAGGSTFGNAVDSGARFNRKAIQTLKRKRGYELELRLWNGDCVVDDTSARVNTSFSELGKPGGVPVTLLAANAVGPTEALARLNNALAECNGEAAGMIHAPTYIADLWAQDSLNTQVIDYGDGMGPREILVTKTRGNIVVSGAGYGTVGPHGTTVVDGETWLFATSMVHLVWDKIRTLDPYKDYKTNQVTATASQIIGATFDPCCVFAVKVANNFGEEAATPGIVFNSPSFDNAYFNGDQFE